MAVTLSTKLYAPEVWEDLAQTEFVGKVVVANAALNQDTLVGSPGDQVDFPKWDLLGELDDLTEGTPIVPEVLGQSSTKAVIKEAGKGVEITDKALLVGLGDPQGEATRQFGILAARKVDSDLITVAQGVVTGGITKPDGTVVGDSTPYLLSPAAGNMKLTWPMIVDAQAMFGDDFDLADIYGLFVRSDMIADLYKDTQFITAANMASGNDLIRRGFLGQIGGMDVFTTNRLAAKKAIILKKNAIGVLWKRHPIVEQDRDILARTNVITTNLHYAVKRLNDKGVVVITTSAT